LRLRATYAALTASKAHRRRILEPCFCLTQIDADAIRTRLATDRSPPRRKVSAAATNTVPRSAFEQRAERASPTVVVLPTPLTPAIRIPTVHPRLLGERTLRRHQRTLDFLLEGVADYFGARIILEPRTYRLDQL